MKLKWYGTATILIEQDGAQLLFDPFIPLNAELFKPPIDELAAVESIFATHGHFDHISAIPAILKSVKCNATVYCCAKTREKLIAQGAQSGQTRAVAPGDVLDIYPFEVRVHKGKHVVFDKILLIKKLSSFLVPANWGKLRRILKLHSIYNEAGEILVVDIRAKDKRILFLGSLGLDENAAYPKGIDLLILPLQGRSDIHAHAMRIVECLQPKKVMLHHFDNSFTPFSSSVSAEPFISLMLEQRPDVEVICPAAGADWIMLH